MMNLKDIREGLWLLIHFIIFFFFIIPHSSYQLFENALDITGKLLSFRS